MRPPWRDWVPGVLSSAQVQLLVSGGFLTGTDEGDLGESALDLTLSEEGWTLAVGAIKPGGPAYLARLRDSDLAKPLEKPAPAWILKTKHTYLFRLAQTLNHSLELADAQFYGQATAKSSIGRLDVLARFILDGMVGYENFEPSHLKAGSGEMFLEVTPMSFDIAVKPGTSLSQLRLFYGRPEDVEIRGDLLWRTVVRGRDDAYEDRMLSVTLAPHRIGGVDAIAFSARRDLVDVEPLETWRKDAYDPWLFWRIIRPQDRNRLLLEPSHFYILRSQERLWLPADVAAYCRATDETIGEMRIHYAGFVHPHFGRFRGDDRGTPLIFEVRGHDLPISLGQGEKMARLVFYRMSQAAEPPKDTTYQKQELKLSGLFRQWPELLASNGTPDTYRPAGL